VANIEVIDPDCDFRCASQTLFKQVVQEFNTIVARKMAEGGRRLAFDWSSLQLSQLVKIGKVIITGDGTESAEEEITINDEWEFDGVVRGWSGPWAALLSFVTAMFAAA